MTVGEPVQAEVIAALRRKIAAVPARATSGPSSDPTSAADVTTALPVPDHLQPVLPRGGLPRGTVAEMTGASGPVISLVASVSAAGGRVALVAMPSAGLLAAVEQGAELSNIALIADPGPDPLSVLAVLADGLDLIVWDPARALIKPSAERATAGRLRAKQSVLVTTSPGWGRPDLRVHADVVGYAGLLPGGRGRIQAVEVRVRALGRGVAPTETTYRLGSGGGAVVAATVDWAEPVRQLRAAGR